MVVEAAEVVVMEEGGMVFTSICLCCDGESLTAAVLPVLQ